MHNTMRMSLRGRQSAGILTVCLNRCLTLPLISILTRSKLLFFAFKSPLSKGVIFADEVGLGKTIEAGLVLCQYWAVGKREIIIICPASIRKQWGYELTGKVRCG